MKSSSLLCCLVALLVCSCSQEEITVRAGRKVVLPDDVRNFRLTCEVSLSPRAKGLLRFHTSPAADGGYSIVLHNGPIDGTLKSGSLMGVRNLYRSLADDIEWMPLEVIVAGHNIRVLTGGVTVVNYTEPDAPYRTGMFARSLLGQGRIAFLCEVGKVRVRDIRLTTFLGSMEGVRLSDGPNSPPVDEQHDRIIRLQQQLFPVIDYHVHLKGGLTKEQAHQMSMAYGINYGVAPNAGEGGVGRMLANDDEVYEYYNEVKPLPFLCGVQGEGRRWTSTFSAEALGVFDYLFTDAMTIRDQAGRITRLYHPEEILRDGLSDEEYMDVIVSQTVKIFTNDPADICANATYLPDDMQPRYDDLWTDERINSVLDVLERYHIALEISPRYRIPSMKIIRMAKQRGLKFTFGTNNVDADFGRLEYALDAIEQCGLTPDDIWFPSMSIRRKRKTVLY